MALDVRTVWEIQQNATSANANGGGFNPANANMLTDLTTDANTANTNSPIVSSASYNFVAGDVGNWVYIKSGTNWTPGWYKILNANDGTSGANKALLSAAIGAAIQPNWNTSFLPTAGYPPSTFVTNTAAGCATVGTPTNGTFAIDYSQSTGAIVTLTNGTCTTPSTTLTSATTSFTKVMVGNILHITSATGVGAVLGWFEIVSVTDGNNIVLDRTPAPSNNTSSTNFKIGGAISLGSSTANQTDDIFFELGNGTNGTGAMRFFIKNTGTNYTTQAISIGTGVGGTQAPVIVEGYQTLRGDATATNAPIFTPAAGVALTFGTNWDVYNLSVYGITIAAGLSIGASGKCFNCKSINTSTTSTRVAITAAVNTAVNNCEAVSYRGTAISLSSSNGSAMSNYIHDSDIGVISPNGTNGGTILGNIIEGMISAAIKGNASAETGRLLIERNTLYGSEAKMGSGFIAITAQTNIFVTNNIFYGFVTAIVHPDVQSVAFDDYNDYFNNTTDVSATAGGASDATRWQKGVHDLAVNPTFASASQITGTAGEFVAGNSKLVDRNKDFTALGITGSVNGVPKYFVYISAGTGITNSGMYVGITSVSTTFNANDTLNLDVAQGTNTTQDKVYTIGLNRNFAVGTNLKAVGFPGAFKGGYTTGYYDIGAVQRQEAGGSGGFFIQ